MVGDALWRLGARLIWILVSLLTFFIIESISVCLPYVVLHHKYTITR